MRDEKIKGRLPRTTLNETLLTNKQYTQSNNLSSQNQTKRIAIHRQRMPRQYRKVYDAAMTGKSLRAAVNSQCIECIGYDLREVKLCCSPQCPLFPYRPLRGVSYGVSDVGQSEPESANVQSEGRW